MSATRTGMGVVSGLGWMRAQAGRGVLLASLVAGLGTGGCCGSKGMPSTDSGTGTGAGTTATPSPGGMQGTKAPTGGAAAPAPAGDVDAKGVPAIPTGRSAPPTVAEWSAVNDINQATPNAKPRDCEIKIVREWMKIHCEGNVRGTEKEEGLGKEGSDYFRAVTPGKMADFVVRLRKGNAIKMRILRSPQSATLFVNWAGNADRPGTIVMNIFAG